MLLLHWLLLTVVVVARDRWEMNVCFCRIILWCNHLGNVTLLFLIVVIKIAFIVVFLNDLILIWLCSSSNWRLHVLLQLLHVILVFHGVVGTAVQVEDGGALFNIPDGPLLISSQLLLLQQVRHVDLGLARFLDLFE